MDETSYRRNEALFTSTGRKAEFDQAFIRLKEAAGYGEYAYIAKQDRGGCWFLDTNNRCRLHKEAGHSHLDAVCQTYPRYPMSTSRGIELTLSFSCPAVLKLADREEPLAIIKADQQPMAFPENNYAVEIYPQQQSPWEPLHYYFELETHFIDILQCRSLVVTGPGDYLLENFLVSFIFRKPFYIYGFEKTSLLLERLWGQMRDTKTIAAAILQFEFQYGHDRQALWR
ncbi:MAG: hypothetical protein H6Q71_1985 [Firmicutes bacterium]|nr:hypothetical protein [Bacillota bacterium]